MEAEAVLFLSDTPEEVAAARAAGLAARLIDRTGASGDIASFDEVALTASPEPAGRSHGRDTR